MKKIFIGIDFSKEKFDATLIKAEGVKECGPSVHEVFDNKTSGYRHSLVRQRVALTNRRSEKRLTQEKSDVKAFMSFTSKHLITEINKAIAKCDEKIRDIISSDEELREVFDIITSMPGIGAQSLYR